MKAKVIAFGENMRYLRKQRGLKQSQIGELFGLTNSTWSNYERGYSLPDVETLIKISDYFDVPETRLLHYNLSEFHAQLQSSK